TPWRSTDVNRKFRRVGRTTWNSAFRAACLAIGALALWMSPLLADEPGQLLARAEQLADLYNWYDAEPLYAEAESGFNLAGDKRNVLFARVSRLRGEMQIRGLTQLVDDIDSILETDVAKGDKALQLRCLIVRGDVDLEID